MERFEDSPAWQKARELHHIVYARTRTKPMMSDLEYCRQIRAASLSAMNNIAEGFERYRLGEIHQFLSIAKGSAAEVRSMLYAGLDVGHLTDEEFQHLMRTAMDLTRLVAAWRSAVQREIRTSRELREDPADWDSPILPTSRTSALSGSRTED